jgi:sodium-dependent phosphate transporter
MEFAGAMLVGARVTDTIRTKVISIKLFESDPSVLMLAMTCAIVGSATFLTIATRFTMPVSTTHSIMGGVIGVGIAAAGTGGVNWSFKGVSSVFAAWGIAPGISGCFAAIIFMITKYGVMRRSNPVKWSFGAYLHFQSDLRRLLTSHQSWFRFTSSSPLCSLLS